MDIEKILFDLCKVVCPHLNERQRRLLTAATASSLGRGGVSRVARVMGTSRTTIYHGLKDLERKGESAGSFPVRNPGGGRKKAIVADPDLLHSLVKLLADGSCNSYTLLNWTSRSTRHLARELAELGHPVSHMVIARLLHELGYSLNGNASVREEGCSADREAQFRFINKKVEERLVLREPVLGIGLRTFFCSEVAQRGISTAPLIRFGDPILKEEKAEVDQESIGFAIKMIHRWREDVGETFFPEMRRLFLCINGGTSSAWAANLWKGSLQAMAREVGIEIEVSHMPPGTFKWESIDHRLIHSLHRRNERESWSLCEVTIESIGLHRQMKSDSHPFCSRPTKTEKCSRDKRTASFHDLWNYAV